MGNLRTIKISVMTREILGQLDGTEIQNGLASPACPMCGSRIAEAVLSSLASLDGEACLEPLSDSQLESEKD